MTPGTTPIIDLNRFFNPSSVAIVGATDKGYRSNNAFDFLSAAGVEIVLVNPNRGELYGRKTYPDLTAVGRPVDAVLSIVNAETSVQLVDEAARTGCGGVVILAAGYAEVGGRGEELQRELIETSRRSGIPVVGPNCVGFVNVMSGAWVSGSPWAPMRKGAIGIVTQSGALMRSEMAAATERALGLSYVISCGNEAALGLVDYLDFLVEDPSTKAICLMLENIRKPAEFLAAAERARSAGKPIVALKVGRGARGREIARSHTGSLVADGWTYEVAFRQVGVTLATDMDDLFDRLAFFEQLPPQKWTRVDGLGVLTMSGGGAGLFSDIAEAEGVDLPELAELRPWISANLAGITTPNPLDMTGFILATPKLIEEVVRKYLDSPAVDSIVVIWGLAKADDGFGKPLLDALIKEAAGSPKPMIVASYEASAFEPWTEQLREAGIARGRGIRPTLRGLSTMAAFIRPGSMARVRETPPPIARPASEMNAPEGPALPFVETMNLLAQVGVPVAPYAVIEGDDVPAARFDFDEPFVVKLADVAHRTEIGAVSLSVQRSEVAAEAARLRAVAAQHALPARIVVQPMLASDGEAFIGIDTSSEFGPVVVFGVGGVFVELLRRVSGGLAPLNRDDALRMLDELELPALFSGFRGKRPWDREQLATLLRGAGRLAAGGAGWLRSLDVNPLVLTADGFVAVDALCLLKHDE
jgi:acetate---CoA ligase (ADP-forming)